MVQTSILKYQRLSLSTDELLHRAGFTSSQVSFSADETALLTPATGHSNAGGIQTQQDSSTAVISSPQVAPRMRTAGVLHGTEGHGSAETDQSARPPLSLDPSSRHITGDQSTPRPPPPSHHQVAPAHSDATALEDGGADPASPQIAAATERAGDADSLIAEGGGAACFVCEDAEADAVLIECGHGGLCAGEAQRFSAG